MLGMLEKNDYRVNPQGDMCVWGCVRVCALKMVPGPTCLAIYTRPHGLSKEVASQSPIS